MDDTARGTLLIGPASVYVGLSIFTMRQYVKDGVIPCAKYGGKLHFRLADLDNYINANMLEVA